MSMLKKLNKKGVIHADWAISMGIFIIYVSFLVIFIIPLLLTTQFDPSPLFKSFEVNFLEQIKWTIIKIPLAIKTLKDKPAPNPAVGKLIFEFTDDLKPDFIFKAIQPQDDGVGKGLQSLLESVGPGGQPDSTPEQFGFTDESKDRIIFRCEEVCKDIILKFTIASIKKKNKPEFSLQCNPDEEDICKASLGIEEDILGLKETQITPVDNDKESTAFEDFKGLKSGGYGQVRILLKFPE